MIYVVRSTSPPYLNRYPGRNQEGWVFLQYSDEYLLTLQPTNSCDFYIHECWIQYDFLEIIAFCNTFWCLSFLIFKLPESFWNCFRAILQTQEMNFKKCHQKICFPEKSSEIEIRCIRTCLTGTHSAWIKRCPITNRGIPQHVYWIKLIFKQFNSSPFFLDFFSRLLHWFLWIFVFLTRTSNNFFLLICVN